MGKGGAPCRAKVGLKRGPWTPAEDMKLIAHIQKFGHENWRALPKHAGLLRCGKSCRLRWINYLRPDIKRGDYTQEEEETIIKLHGLLGNKWSKIASQLPGRTDNEIKNVWHTHLKKKISKKLEPPPPPPPIQDQKESTINIQTSSSDSMLSNDHHVYCKGINPVEKQIDPIEKVEPSKDPIEIPMYPNMGIWNMQLDDGSPSLDVTQFAEVDSICNANLNMRLATKLQPNYSAHDKPQPTMSYSPTSSACSTHNSSRLCLSQLSDGDSIFAEKSQAGKCGVMINLPNEYSMDTWGMLDQDDARELLPISVGSERKLEAQNAAKEERESEEDIEDHKSWLMDLEYELELRANKEEQPTLVAVAGLDEPLDYSPTNFDGTLGFDVDPIVAYFHTHPSSPICF